MTASGGLRAAELEGELRGVDETAGASLAPAERRAGVRRRATRRLARSAPSLVAAVVVLAFWQASSAFLDPITISTPSAILASIPRTFLHGPNGALGSALGVTLVDLFYGFGASVVVGIAAGLAIGNSSVLRRLLDPIVALGNSSPTIALLPLMIVWLGFGRSSRVLFIGVVSVWAIIINTSIGARVARERYRDLAPAFEVPPRMYLMQVVVPGAMPYILTGLRISLAHALVATIISGQEIGESGIGGLAEQYGTQFATNDLFGVVVVTTVIALLLYKAIEIARNRVCPWVNYA